MEFHGVKPAPKIHIFGKSSGHIKVWADTVWQVRFLIPISTRQDIIFAFILTHSGITFEINLSNREEKMKNLG